jgi:hypothetical protein
MVSIKGAVDGFFGRFDPVEASLKAGIEYLVAGGYFGTQLEGIPENDDDIINQSAGFSKALIPFLGTKQDSWMHELLDRFLQNYEMYLYYKEINDKIEDNLKPTHTMLAVKDMLVSEGKIILSLTYGRIENKTIVLNKGFIFDPNMMRKPDTKVDNLLEDKVRR